MVGETNSVPTGIVKFVNEDKGYGFIKPDEGGQDVFLHARDLERSGLPRVAEEMRLGFEVEMDPRRGTTRATRIRLL